MLCSLLMQLNVIIKSKYLIIFFFFFLYPFSPLQFIFDTEDIFYGQQDLWLSYPDPLGNSHDAALILVPLKGLEAALNSIIVLLKSAISLWRLQLTCCLKCKTQKICRFHITLYDDFLHFKWIFVLQIDLPCYCNVIVLASVISNTLSDNADYL